MNLALDVDAGRVRKLSRIIFDRSNLIRIVNVLGELTGVVASLFAVRSSFSLKLTTGKNRRGKKELILKEKKQTPRSLRRYYPYQVQRVVLAQQPELSVQFGHPCGDQIMLNV